MDQFEKNYIDFVASWLGGWRKAVVEADCLVLIDANVHQILISPPCSGSLQSTVEHFFYQNKTFPIVTDLKVYIYELNNLGCHSVRLSEKSLNNERKQNLAFWAHLASPVGDTGFFGL